MTPSSAWGFLKRWKDRTCCIKNGIFSTLMCFPPVCKIRVHSILCTLERVCYYSSLPGFSFGCFVISGLLLITDSIFLLVLALIADIWIAFACILLERVPLDVSIATGIVCVVFCFGLTIICVSYSYNFGL